MLAYIIGYEFVRVPGATGVSIGTPDPIFSNSDACPNAVFGCDHEDHIITSRLVTDIALDPIGIFQNGILTNKWKITYFAEYIVCPDSGCYISQFVENCDYCALSRKNAVWLEYDAWDSETSPSLWDCARRRSYFKG